MDTDLSKIQQLVERPGESLSVELKRWIDPDQPEGKAKIARAAIALRNFNGGYLVIGFDNDTLEPDVRNAPNDVKSVFHIDKIQGIVSRLSDLHPRPSSTPCPWKSGIQFMEIPNEHKPDSA